MSVWNALSSYEMNLDRIETARRWPGCSASSENRVVCCGAGCGAALMEDQVGMRAIGVAVAELAADPTLRRVFTR